MEYSAKWDPIPTILCQNHTQLVKGFMGQTTAFRADKIKSNVLVMGNARLMVKLVIFMELKEKVCLLTMEVMILKIINIESEMHPPF